MFYRQSLFLGVVFSLAFASVCSAGEDIPEIPAKALKPEGFAVNPWTVDSLAVGDLNKDGLPDAALTISIGGQGFSAVDRKLIIAFKKKDGSYEKVLDNDRALVLGGGPSGGTPTVQIKKGVVVVEHYCGSRERYEYQHKYQYRNGQWLLIGYTASTYDSLGPEYSQALDVNVMTGEVAASNRNGDKSTRERFLELWAAPIAGPEPSPSDWGAPAVRLQSTGSKGALSGTLQAVHTKKKLFVKGQLSSGSDVTPAEVALVDSNGKVIAAESSRATIYGYSVNAYDLTSGPLKEMSAKSTNASTGSTEPVLRVSINIKPRDSAGWVLSTSGKKRPGAIFLSKNKYAPELKDIDMRDGDPIHPFLYELPNN